MKSPQTVIKLLESNNSRLEKEKILKEEINNQNTEFFDGVRLALDNFITFGVKKVPSFSGPDGQGLPWVAFLELANSLASRKLTGNDAKAAIELALSASTAEQWNNWYRRILIKDLRCNMSEKTVNKVLKGTNIPPIPIFTCQRAEDANNHPKKMVGKKLIDFKLDGVRCLTVVNIEANTVVQYSRNGLVLANFQHITDGILQHIHKFEQSVVIDGEVISDSFQALMTQVNRKTDVNSSDARLMAFDIIPLDEFRSGVGTLPQLERREMLKSLEPIFDEIKLKNGTPAIGVVDYITVDLDTDAGKYEFEVYNRLAIARNYEGIMIKDPTAVYQCKKGTAWLKLKPSITVDLTIVGLEPGSGKYENTLGALVCSGVDHGKEINVSVGSGLSDDLRDQIWSDKESVIGHIVEIKADAITKSAESETYSLRFPRFERFRSVDKGSKI